MNRGIFIKADDFAHAGRGLLMGGADIIPGVSGGTVALILGIYIRLVTAISHFDLTFLGHVRAGRWRAAAEHVDLRFLLALAAGIGLGILGLASLMNYLLFPVDTVRATLTLALFFGLILSSSFVVARSITPWSWVIGILAAAGAVFAFWLVGQPFMAGSKSYGYTFVCGTVAICAMILPGISGAFILYIMGKYEHVTGIIRGLPRGDVTLHDVVTLAVFAIGCAMGLLAFSKLLRWLLAHYQPQTLAVLCGFMLGSLRRIWPFKQQIGEAADVKHARYENIWPAGFDGQVAGALFLLLAGVAAVLALDWLTRRHAKHSMGLPGDGN
jgi:putative membrane protein